MTKSSDGIRPSKLEAFGAPQASQLDVWGLPRGPHDVAPDTIQASQRARMLYGVVAAVAERGYAHCTVADICRVAHVSRKTFYEQFVSREACFLAAYETGHSSLVASLLACQNDSQTWEERLAATIRGCLLFFRDNPELARALLIEVRGAGDRAWAIFDASHARLARMQRNLYRMRQAEQPGLPDLPMEIFSALVAGVERLVTAHIRSNRLHQLMEIEPAFHYLLRSVWAGEANAVAALCAVHSALPATAMDRLAQTEVAA